jgi:hypothetical protein
MLHPDAEIQREVRFHTIVVLQEDRIIVALIGARTIDVVGSIGG